MSQHQFRTKTVRCRYFDDSGKSLKQKCNLGNLCSFAHPDERQWAVALSASRKSADTADARPRSRIKSVMASPPPTRRPVPPLTPQAEVFKRAVPEVLDSDERKQSLARTYAQRSYLGVEKPEDRNPERSNRGARVIDERARLKIEDSTRSPPRQPRARDIFSPASLPTEPRNHDLIIINNDIDPTPRPGLFLEIKKGPEGVVELFRKLAKASNQVLQDTVAMEREAQKLETFTELSSTLAKVSSAAAASVAPALANIVQNHALYKAHVEEELGALSHIWEDVFQVFVTGVSNVLDLALQDAIRKLKGEGEKISVDIQARDITRKKKREEEEDRTDRDRKRRRVDLEEGQVTEKGRFSSRSDSRDTLEMMRSKLERQAQRLEHLANENSELKSVLRQPRTSSDVKSDDWSERCPDESMESGDTSLWERINQGDDRGR